MYFIFQDTTNTEDRGYNKRYATGKLPGKTDNRQHV